MHNIDDTECGNITKNIVSLTKHYYELEYCTCMASLTENKSFCEVRKYVINTRSHCPKLMKFTCYTNAQSCWNIGSCIATIAIQLPKIDKILL